MKSNLFRMSAFLCLITLFSACEKETSDEYQSDMTGRWQVERIETRVYDASGTSVVSSASIPFQPTDYIDFKNNENDELEMNLGQGNRVAGNYVVLMGGTFNISLSNKLLFCNTESLTEKSFIFTGTVDNSNPKVTETYYLVR
ncbi:hypothetical protein [Pedobacter sp.]|uniref:hypothetical protein n=1 Tax=Pedobacter sp. TaxID=1411316 RepID=UPI003D7F2B0E